MGLSWSLLSILESNTLGGCFLLEAGSFVLLGVYGELTVSLPSRCGSRQAPLQSSFSFLRLCLGCMPLWGTLVLVLRDCCFQILDPTAMRHYHCVMSHPLLSQCCSVSALGGSILLLFPQHWEYTLNDVVQITMFILLDFATWEYILRQVTRTLSCCLAISRAPGMVMLLYFYGGSFFITPLAGCSMCYSGLSFQLPLQWVIMILIIH